VHSSNSQSKPAQGISGGSSLQQYNSVSNRNANVSVNSGIGSERGQTPQLATQNNSVMSAGAAQPSNGGNYRNENILCAVLALLKELDESGLELVKRDIDRKLSNKKQNK
jgi:hypothetical protein